MYTIHVDFKKLLIKGALIIKGELLIKGALLIQLERHSLMAVVKSSLQDIELERKLFLSFSVL